MTKYFLILIAFSISAINVNATINQELSKEINHNKSLQELNNKIAIIKAQAKLAKAKIECQKNGGCIDNTIVNIVAQPININQTQATNKANQKLINDPNNIPNSENDNFTSNSFNASLLEQLNHIQIVSIVNNFVRFKGIERNFTINDMLFNKFKITAITVSGVVVDTSNNKKHRIFMNWTNDEINTDNNGVVL